MRSQDDLGSMGWRLVALAIVGSVAILSYVRSVSGITWLLPVLGAAWLSQSLTNSLRRIDLWRITAVGVSSFVGIWFLFLVLFPETTFYGAPTLTSIDAAVTAMSSAWERIPRVAPPVMPDAGYLSLLIVGAWLTSSLAAAFISIGRSYAPLVPWLAFFTIGAATGSPLMRKFFAVSFIASLLCYLLADVVADSRHGQSWFGAFGKLGRTSPARFRVALRLGGLSILGAILIPGILPGYNAAPIVDWSGAGLQSSRIEISPFVQIRPRLNQSQERVMFTVVAERPSYWKLASLNHFDGETWQLKGKFVRTSGKIRINRPPSRPIEALRQKYEIRALAGAWVPAAYAPVEVKGLQILVDEDHDTLLTDRLREGQVFEVHSEVPHPAFETLRSARANGAGSQFLALPPSINSLIREIAEGVSAAAPTPYEKALAIQEYLKTFTYNEEVPAGHSEDYLVRFLTNIRAGYCEQFAGSMAVMLRTIGIPARVAVGFLPGTSRGEHFVVTNRDAHAWPEAYFEGVGWIAFEPTPRAGVIEPPAGEQTAAPPVTSTTTPGTTSGDSSSVTPDEFDEQGTTASPRNGSIDRVDIARKASIRVFVASLVVIMLLMIARQLVTRLPRLVARTPTERVRAAFNDFLLRAEDAFRPKHLSETEMEFVAAIERDLSLPVHLTRALVEVYQVATYSSLGPTSEVIPVIEGAAAKLRRAMWLKAGWPGRLRMAISPRPVWRWAQFAVLERLTMRASSAARSA